MTLQGIAARRAELQEQLQKETQNQANASRLVDTINGALQDCDFWANKLAESEAKSGIDQAGDLLKRTGLELVRDDSFVEQGA